MPLSSKVIRVPVKLVDGQWELLYGGPVKVKDGAFGELHLDRVHFTDKAFLKALTEKRKVAVLPSGTELRVALTIKAGLDQRLRPFLLYYASTPHDHTAKISAETRFVSVRLVGPTQVQQRQKMEGGGLWLCLEGMEPRGVESGMVELPHTHELEAVDSLNYAFTRMSEVFEPWRKAHTGSIYERVFYQERNGRWYQIKDLWLSVAEQFGTGLK